MQQLIVPLVITIVVLAIVAVVVALSVQRWRARSRPADAMDPQAPSDAFRPDARAATPVRGDLGSPGSGGVGGGMGT